MLKPVVVMPPRIMIGRPSTKPILNILVPMIFPTMISNSPFLAEVTAITNSGVLVPITRMTIVISFSLIWRSLAIATQESTAKLLPTNIAIRPQIEMKIDLGRGHFGLS